MRLRSALYFIAGGLATWAALQAHAQWRHARVQPGVSTQAQAMPLERFEAHAAKVLSGQPNFRVARYAGSADGKTSSGVWAADGPSSFEWRFHADEAVYIHEGLVEVDYLGRKFSLKAGDTAYFHGGTTATWTVPQHVRKSWTVHETGRLTRWLRRMAG